MPRKKANAPPPVEAVVLSERPATPATRRATFKANVGRMQLNGLPGGAARMVTFTNGEYTTQDAAEIDALRELARKGYVKELP